MIDPAISPLAPAWARAKARPTQFNSWKNMPGKRSSSLTYGPSPVCSLQEPDVNIDEPATTPGPEEVNGGDFKPQVLQSAVQGDTAQGPVEVQELPKPE